VWLCGSIRSFVLHVVLCGEACRHDPLKTKIKQKAYTNAQSVPRSKHTPIIQTGQLMLYIEIIAVCSQIHTKHINTMCGQNVELYINTQSVPRSKHTLSLL
jgi:hypothetical protein